MKTRFLPLFLLLAAFAPCAGATVTATTDAFRLDLRASPRKVEPGGSETLAFSGLWADPENPAAGVRIAIDGTEFSTLPGGEGTFDWTPDCGGLFTFTHTALGANGTPYGDVYQAQFLVENFSFADGDIVAEGYEGIYDGEGHGISVTCSIPGATVKYATAQGGPYTANPLLFTNAVESADGWYVVEAPFYLAQTNRAAVSISRMKVATPAPQTRIYNGAEQSPGYVDVPDVWYVKDSGAAVDAGTYEAYLLFRSENYEWEQIPEARYSGGQVWIPFTIQPRPLTVMAEAKSKVYGESDPALTWNADGLVAGDALTGALSREQGEAVGTYAIKQGTLAASANYALSFTGATFTITKATMPGADAIAWGVSGAGARFTYDGAEHSVALTGLPDGVTATYEGNRASDAGDYTATAHLIYDTANYESITDPAPLAWGIDRRPATVRSADGTWTYDTTEHSAPTVVATGFVAGEGVTARDFAVVTDVTPAAGVPNSFAYDWNAGTWADNYDLAVEFGTLKVAPRTIGDDPANWDIRLGKNPTYDGTEKSAPVAQVCYVKPDGNLENIPYSLSGDKATDAGNYVLTITGSGNYAGSVMRDWAIMPRNVTLSSGNATWTYDGAAHSETAVAVGGDGFAPGESFEYAGFPSVRHVADTAAGIANEFSWTPAAGAKASNYEVRTSFGTVAVTPRAVTLTAPTKTKPYDGTPLTFGADEIAVHLTDGSSGGLAPPSGSSGGLALPEGESFAFLDFASITDAGQVAATFAYADGTARTGDYAITVAEGATLAVTRSAAEIVVQAGSESWTYDGAAHFNRTWTATNLDTLVAGDALEVAFDETSVARTPLDGPLGDGVVSNAIASVRVRRGGEGGADVTANYALSWYPGTLRVTPRPVTLTSASATKPYDGTPLVAHDFAVGGDGFVGTDGATCSYTGSQTEKGASANAFTWTLTPGTTAEFYNVTAAEGTLTVTALDIGGGAEDWTVELGPALTYNGIEQVQTVRAATFKGLPVDYAVEDDRATDAGDYALTLVGQGNFTGRWTVPWRIAPKALSLAAGSASKVYDGTPLTCGDVSATGFVAGEGAAYRCTSSQTAAGTSANEVGDILWADGTKGSNYAVTKTAGTLTVTRRPVTLTAPTKTKPYDGTPLTFGADEIAVRLTDGSSGGLALPSGSSGGLALPEGESFAFSDFASITDAGQVAATFAWAAGPGTLAADYAVTMEAGTLTVNRSAAEIVVTAKDGTWVFDGAAHTLHEWTAENLGALVAGDALEVSFDEASAITEPGEAANTITCVRVMRGGADVSGNYALSWWPGTLRVTSAPIAPFMAQSDTSDSATYDGAGHGVSVAAPALLTSPVTVRYAATADGPWGATPVSFTDAGAWTAFFRVEAPCYETYVGTTTMTITPREVTLVSAGATKTYDGTPLRRNEVTVKAGSLSFPAGEGFTAQCTGVVTDVGGVENAFDYALTGGAKAGNYTIRKEYGWLRVTPATMNLGALAEALSWRGPYDGTPHGMRSTVPYPRAVVSFALESGNEEAYSPVSPTWTDASTNTVFFKVMAPNYNPAYGAGTVAIAPRDIALAQIGALTNEFYTGYAIEPVPAVTDTVPITEEDWTMRWEDNVEAGTAKAVVCGRRNYGGEALREFEIEYKPEVVVVIDLSNITVGQGWWGSASLLTNGIAVPAVRPGVRTEVTVPTETAIDLAFTPDPGFRIGSIIVDNRLWTTNAVWNFPALRADKIFDAGFLPAPQTTLSWKRGGDGRQYATLSFVNHTGYAEALKDLSFLFADKEWLNNGVLTTNMLVGVDSQPRQPVEERDGATYRRVDFDTSKLATTAVGTEVSFGGVNLRSDEGIVRMYSAKRNLDALVGCMAWETNGKRYYQPLVGSGAIIGLVAEDIVTAAAFNQALALGFDAALMATAKAKCRFTDFSFDPFTGAFSGGFEVYAETREGYEAASSGLDPARTTIRLLGCDSLGGEWREVASAQFDPEGGAVAFYDLESAEDEPRQFYRVAIEVAEVFE